MQLTESVCLLSDPLAMGAADLEEIAVAGDKEKYPVWFNHLASLFVYLLPWSYPVGCYVCVFVTLCRMV